jgi:hypothetical protein
MKHYGTFYFIKYVFVHIHKGLGGRRFCFSTVEIGTSAISVSIQTHKSLLE